MSVPLPVLDGEALDRLTRIGGVKLPAQMIDLFVAQAAARGGAVRTGLDGGDLREAERGAHSLKSTAGNLGAARLADAARTVEEALVRSDVEAARSAAPALYAALDAAVAALAARRKEMTW